MSFLSLTTRLVIFSVGICKRLTMQISVLVCFLSTPLSFLTSVFFVVFPLSKLTVRSMSLFSPYNLPKYAKKAFFCFVFPLQLITGFSLTTSTSRFTLEIFFFLVASAKTQSSDALFDIRSDIMHGFKTDTTRRVSYKILDSRRTKKMIQRQTAVPSNELQLTTLQLYMTSHSSL